MTTLRQLVEPIAAAQRALWAGYMLALVLFCTVAWKIGSLQHGIGLPIWENATGAIYGGSVLCAIGALLLRHSVYARADELRAAFYREVATLPADEQQVPARAHLGEALAELSRRERSVWTLCVGPAVVGLPSALLSGDARPMVPLAVASLALLLLTFPRTQRFAGEIRGRGGAGIDSAGNSC